MIVVLLSLRCVLYIVLEQRHVLQYLTRVNGIAFLCSHGPPLLPQLEKCKSEVKIESDLVSE